MDKKATRKRRKKQRRFAVLYRNFINSNIFELKKWDGVLYLILYVLIPVVITSVSLSALPSDTTSIIYCYLTILISAVNGIYDGANRWNSEEKSLYNIKIFIIEISNGIIGAYCLYVILYISISNSVDCRHDGILFVYFITIGISLFDMFTCFTRDMALKDLMGEEVME